MANGKKGKKAGKAKKVEKAVVRAVKAQAQKKAGKRAAKKWFTNIHIPSVKIPGFEMAGGGSVNFGSGAPIAQKMSVRNAMSFNHKNDAGASCAGKDEFLGVYNGTTTEAAGDTLLTYYLNPTLLPVPRLNTFAALFQKFTIRKLVLKIKPLNPSTVGGGYIGFISYDIQEQLNAGGFSGIRQALSHITNCEERAWAPRALSYNKTGEWMYVQPDVDDLRLSSPGYFQLLTMGPIESTSSFMVTADFEYEFCQATIQAADGAAAVFNVSRIINDTTTGMTNAKPFGTDELYFQYNGFSVGYNSSTGVFYWSSQFAGQAYFITMNFAGAVCTDPSLASTNLSASYSAIGTLTGGTKSLFTMVAVSTNVGVITVTPSMATFTTPSRAEFILYPYNTTAHITKNISTRARVDDITAKVDRLQELLQKVTTTVMPAQRPERPSSVCSDCKRDAWRFKERTKSWRCEFCHILAKRSCTRDPTPGA